MLLLPTINCLKVIPDTIEQNSSYKKYEQGREFFNSSLFFLLLAVVAAHLACLLCVLGNFPMGFESQTYEILEPFQLVHRQPA